MLYTVSKQLLLKSTKMQKISAEKLAEIVGFKGNLAKVEISGITTDSRRIRQGDLFVALKGENFDGHDFAADVLNKGAALVLVEHPVAGIAANRQIVVKDTLAAFGAIGAYNRSLFKGKVIGLTGSAGKTTTKEEIKFALSLFGKVCATTGNHNNRIGVPITLCDMDMNADYAVVEMGMSAKGEITELTGWVQPDAAIITNVYPMHIEFFDDFTGIAEAKAEIFQGLKKGGLAIINEDTNFADLLRQRATEAGAKVITFGKNTHPAAKLQLGSDAGEHQYYNAWCALTLVKALGLDVAKAAAHLANFNALPGRGEKLKLKLPTGGEYTLIDDSYSGQPEAMKIAIETLNKMPHTGRKIAVLGKMAELGNTSKARHIEIGKTVAAGNIDIVVGVCPEMKDMLAQVPETKEKHYFESKDGLAEFLLNKCLQNNDIVLIKGARYSSKLYQVVDTLKAEGKINK